MRGLGTGTGEFRIDSKVSIYLDDQPMTAISQQADVRLIDIERVEALPGPQGTLFGSSAQAGTIHYVTNKPDISGYSSEVVGRGRHDQGRRPELRRQQLGQHPGERQFRHARGRLLVRRRRLRGQRRRPDADGRSATTPTSPRTTRTSTGRRAAACRACGPSTRTGTCSRPASTSAATRWAPGRPTRSSATTRSRASTTNGATMSGRRLSATLKGNLGFAELSLTGSYFDRRIDYQWDNTNYAQYLSYYYREVSYYAAYYSALRPGNAALDDLQLAEAGTLGLRGPPDFAGRQQAAVDGGRLLRGRLGLVGIRRPAPGPA